MCFDHYRNEAQLRQSLTSFRDYNNLSNLYIMPPLRNKKLKELVREDFHKAYDSLSIRGLSAHTVRTLHGATKAVITWATGKRLLREGILKGITLPKIQKTRPEFLSYEEMQ